MSDAKVLKIKTSLALKMERPGGRSFAELSRRAGKETEEHRDRMMAGVRGYVDQLSTLCADTKDVEGNRVYAAAAGIVDVAGYFDTGPLYEAAYSLCETVDNMIGAGNWSWAFVDVHLRALRLIVADDCKSSSMTEILLEGLRAVAEKAAWTESPLLSADISSHPSG